MIKRVPIFIFCILLLSYTSLAAPVVDDPFIEIRRPSFFERLFMNIQAQEIAVDPTKTNIFKPGGKINFVLDGLTTSECTKNTRYVIKISGPGGFTAQKIGFAHNGDTGLQVDSVSKNTYLADFFLWNVPSGAKQGEYGVLEYYICGTSSSSPKISTQDSTKVTITGGEKQCKEDFVGSTFCDNDQDNVLRNRQNKDCTNNAVIVDRCSQRGLKCVADKCADRQQTKCQADLDGEICSGDEICIQGSGKVEFIKTSDTERCCVFGACGTEDELEKFRREERKERKEGELKKRGETCDLEETKSFIFTNDDSKLDSSCETGLCYDGPGTKHSEGSNTCEMPVCCSIDGGQAVLQSIRASQFGSIYQVFPNVCPKGYKEYRLANCGINEDELKLLRELTSGPSDIATSLGFDSSPIGSGGGGGDGGGKTIGLDENKLSDFTRKELEAYSCRTSQECEEPAKCKPYDKLPKNVQTRLSKGFFNIAEEGLCIVEDEEEDKDCGNFIKGLNFIGMENECTGGSIVLFGGIILLIFAFGATRKK